VADYLFSDVRLAALYDRFCPWDERDDLEFYLPRAMAAASVLDVGCGTGMFLHRLRELGHTGRLCGLDPAVGMLEQARTRTDIEWIHGDLTSAAWNRAFDLVVMSGHAFQVLVGDDEIRIGLAAIRSALTDDGRFAFETRNPPVRAWEQWIPENAVEVTDADGATVRMAHQVETPIAGDIVSFTCTFTSPDWDRPQVSRSTLRFLDADALTGFLADAGLVIDEQFGDWDGGALRETSPEIITIARRG
jgi:SAM-dependent methyltransferase